MWFLKALNNAEVFGCALRANHLNLPLAAWESKDVAVTWFSWVTQKLSCWIASYWFPRTVWALITDFHIKIQPSRPDNLSNKSSGEKMYQSKPSASPSPPDPCPPSDAPPISHAYKIFCPKFIYITNLIGLSFVRLWTEIFSYRQILDKSLTRPYLNGPCFKNKKWGFWDKANLWLLGYVMESQCSYHSATDQITQRLKAKNLNIESSQKSEQQMCLLTTLKTYYAIPKSQNPQLR